jgi:hypothetical protein
MAEHSMHLKLQLCIIANFAITLTMAAALSAFYSPDSLDTYVTFGPSPTLHILGVKINTMNRYLALQFCLAIFQISDVIMQDIANPILGFSIYNPDKKIITDFSKNQLQFYAQSFWFIGSLKNALAILLSISQIDIAISKAVYSEIGGVYIIRLLLNEKQFPSSNTNSNGNDIEANFYSQL